MSKILPKFIVGAYEYDAGNAETPEISHAQPMYVLHTQFPKFLATAVPKDSGEPRALKVVQLYDDIDSKAGQASLEKALTEAENWWVKADGFLFGDDE